MESIGAEQIGSGEVGSDDATVGANQASHHGPLSEADALVGAGKGNQRAADFGSRGVAVGVENAGQGVGALAGAQQLASLGIELRAPLDQFRYADWPLGHQRLGGGSINDSIASVYGVFKVESNVLIAFHGDGDSTLRVVRVRLRERLLGDHQNVAVASQLNGCAQSGYARSHHQKIHPRQHCHNL